MFIFGHFPSPRSHGVEKTANELVAGQRLETKKIVAFLEYSPVSSVTYVPRYSCKSVCSWLLIRMNLCPDRCARYSTSDVLPLDVGPCRRIGCRRSRTARAKFARCPRTVGVTTYLPCSGSIRGNSPASTQKCSSKMCVSSAGGFGGFLTACDGRKNVSNVFVNDG